MVTPGTDIPSEVRATASNCFVSPVSIDAMGGLTITLDTIGGGGVGSLTVIVTGELVTPPVAAEIVAIPAPAAVAKPDDALMLTTALLLLVQVKLTSSRTEPPAVSAVAVNVFVSPTFICWADEGLTVIVATGGCVTVIVTVGLDTPFPVALIVAVPGLTAVATPPGLIVTTFVLLLDHAKVTPLTADPSELRADAEKRCVPPTSRDAEVGLTVTLTTDGVTTTGFVGESLPHPTARISAALIPAMRINTMFTYELRIFSIKETPLHYCCSSAAPTVMLKAWQKMITKS